MISRRLFLAGMLTSGVIAPAVVNARFIMPVVTPKSLLPKTPDSDWEPPPWTLVPGFDYDSPWYERVGDGYRVWSADNLRTAWRTPNLGYLSSDKNSLTTVVDQVQFDKILAYYKECPDAKWIHKNGHHDAVPSSVRRYQDLDLRYAAYVGLER